MKTALRSLRMLVLSIAMGTLASAEALRAQSPPPHLRDVVSHHAPTIIAETYSSPYFSPEWWDHILPVDFDGDDAGGNNYDNVQLGNVFNGKPTIYYSIVETGAFAERGYYFINYFAYHPFDAGISAGGLNGTGRHEHDMQGVMLIVKKTWYSPYGEIVVAATQAHGAMVPFWNPKSPVKIFEPAGAGYRGYIRFWKEVTFNVNRPVVAIRSRKHGTYMAQDCSGLTPQVDYGYGMWLYSPEKLGVYKSCVHDDGRAVVYVPIPLHVPAWSGTSAKRLGRDTDVGTFWYELSHFRDSPIWQLRTADSRLFLRWKSEVFMHGGYVGLDAFIPSDVMYMLESNHAGQPPWTWQGGSGECKFGWCWYSFGADNTTNFDDREWWPAAPREGLILTDPARYAGILFPWLPELSEPLRYNPYIVNEPACCTGYPLSVAIDGPDEVDAGTNNSWYARVAGGTPPYTYRWSGALAGSASSISGTLYGDSKNRTLYLDVYDATGARAAVSKYISVRLPEENCEPVCPY